MNVDGFFHDLPELETGRLLLRKLRMTDAQDMYEYSRDPEVARHVLWDAHQSVGDSRGYLRYAVRQYRQDLPASWGIELKENHKLIGTIGFMWINRDHNSAEVGYSLAREYWNRGIMSEALSAVLNEGFMDLNLHRIEAQHEVDNPASGPRHGQMRHDVRGLRPRSSLQQGSLRRRRTLCDFTRRLFEETRDD